MTREEKKRSNQAYREMMRWPVIKAGIIISDPDEISQDQLDWLLRNTGVKGVVCGVGRKNAIKGTKKLIRKGCNLIVNIGLCGGISGNTMVGESITNDRDIYTTDRFLEQGDQLLPNLVEEGYKVVDMEYLYIRSVCCLKDVTLEVQKIVSDHLNYDEYLHNISWLRNIIQSLIQRVVAIYGK